MLFHSQNSTAILIFARSSSEEVHHKKIAKGGKLFEALTEYTLKTVQKTGLPFFHITEEEQLGASFGERFANAIQFVFDKGFEKIITIGNDSPHMTKAHLKATLSELEVNNSVIGPSADGGFYLMGLHRSDFKKSDFVKLPWQTSKLRAEIIKLLSGSSQEIFLLPTLFDVDTLWDVQFLYKLPSNLDQNVLKAILSLTSSNKKMEIPSLFFADGFGPRLPFNKGSPSSFLS